MHTPALGLRTFASSYPGTPEHVSQVRADLRRGLRGCPIAGDVILCVSELAANAVLHSNSRKPGGTYTVRAESRPGASVRIEVEDDGGPWMRKPVSDQASGRGLDIIRALAAEWGITASPAGRAVWARINWPSKTLICPAAAISAMTLSVTEVSTAARSEHSRHDTRRHLPPGAVAKLPSGRSGGRFA